MLVPCITSEGIDAVDSDLVWCEMTKTCVSKNVSCVEAVCQDTKCYVSRAPRIREVEQGCGSSPYPFDSFINDIIRLLTQKGNIPRIPSGA